jgi:hypothetical protein
MYKRKTVTTLIFTKLTSSRYSESLRARRSRDRNLVGATGNGVGHPLPCNTEVKERVEFYLYSPLCLNDLF